MFIRQYGPGKYKYLTVAVKKKNKNGKEQPEDLFRIGNVDKLKKAFKNPKEFFDEMLQSILNYLEDRKSFENDSLVLKHNTSIFNLGFLYIKWILQVLGVDRFFEKIQKTLAISYNLWDIFSFLVFSQIINPSSFLKAWRNQDEFVEPIGIPLYDIYRLSIILPTTARSFRLISFQS